MLFGTKTRPLTDFLPRVLIHLDGADTDMVSTYVMDAIIEFLRDTNILTEIVCIDLEPCKNSYKLHTNRRMVEILHVRLFVDGVLVPSHKLNYQVEGDTLYVEATDQCRDHRLEIEMSVTLPRDSLEVPEFIYEEWVSAVSHLALAKLSQIHGSDWYNVTAAGNHLALYQQDVRKARFNKITKHKPFKMRLANTRRY